MAKVFWDTNLFIYLFEDHPVLGRRVEELQSRMVRRGDRLFTSALTAGEVLVGALTANDAALAARYQDFFASAAITVLAFDLKAAPHYARIRQDRAIARPDAVQLACAAAAEIDLFVTNDDRLTRKVVAGIHFVTSLGAAPI